VADLVAGLVVIAVLAAGSGLVALRVSRRSRRRAERSAAQERTAAWEVGQEGALDCTLVFLRKVTAGGESVDRIPVAQVRDGAPDWGARMLEARAEAANRADLLNAKT